MEKARRLSETWNATLTRYHGVRKVRTPCQALLPELSGNALPSVGTVSHGGGTCAACRAHTQGKPRNFGIGDDLGSKKNVSDDGALDYHLFLAYWEQLMVR